MGKLRNGPVLRKRFESTIIRNSRKLNLKASRLLKKKILRIFNASLKIGKNLIKFSTSHNKVNAAKIASSVFKLLRSAKLPITTQANGQEQYEFCDSVDWTEEIEFFLQADVNPDEFSFNSFLFTQNSSPFSSRFETFVDSLHNCDMQ